MSERPDRIPEWCRGEEWCSVTATASLLGRKWKPVIVDRLLKNGACGFSELEGLINGISGKALSNNLKELEEDEIVNRSVISERPYRVEYALTDRGRDLEPLIVAMREWGSAHFGPDSKKDNP
ncbi:transcriptional regulator (plasmid) [Haloferax mediterranei ATCC 33500]|uniref:Transcriptional regulator n=1 Tax=Haloferax mediterranei (strain ATCC 33500 / DSM 1411 / JCM 8866 / NBRC 14739 / NCIMB 2177 / R-4) TaxID=523841 RepID=I3RBE6_HALMT|nr:helix-turn-helix domain-containing protein [Haloferax mediterranei]AFK21556.1 transcription regulator [Haloferax mediterranei ATCC 33500]AHZ24395.1 HxlR family transcriptional regulator [Haloferax mediterranei ATCC 33500]ELZ97135.1 transcriptional regulator [Haloferax mediterranei ATCC 33500]MDX5990122.1 helix-turn-helix domain-containing protein [Haloferax mediterranei ATCC 33500]QCQ76795.1 transcriptional regulator [Haloferax mediterranei ATCC 33500]